MTDGVVVDVVMMALSLSLSLQFIFNYKCKQTVKNNCRYLVS